MENQLSVNNEEFRAKINSLPVLNQTTFENLKKQTRSQPEVLQEIFKSFFEDVNEMISGLRTSVQTQDYHNYTSTLHTLKGLSGTIGAARLFELTTFLYTQARNNDFSNANNGIEIIHQKIQELEEELEGKL